MIHFIIRQFFRLLPLRLFISRRYYEFIARKFPDEFWTLMNFGYSELKGETARLTLDPALEPERYGIQLYHHVASGVDLKGKDVLEVGSGRGGGAAYIHRYLLPRTMTGVDLSANAVALCNANQAHNGLSFRVGNAEALPFEDASFDVVINVESSHCYGSVEDFLSEVHRVLRPGGHFLFTDVRHHRTMDLLKEQLSSSPLRLLEQRDITPNIIKALELEKPRKLALIAKRVPRFLITPVTDFSAATEDSTVWRSLSSGTSQYLTAFMRKENGT